MTTPIKTIADCAAEAEFQLLCAKNHMDWLLALAHGIQLAHTHGQDEAASQLLSLASYLSDTGFANTSAAIKEFGDLAETPTAPRNADNEIVARKGKGGK
ncbi:hypothetical protein N015_08355 [Pseudomonas asturiensis]|uniref:Uncharacterized protein n=1 Tax=Pseudomonas asturiensis TaxID=1190415 RepID=A0ABX6HA66_9PSED|nr:hypothetical protein [Pseudomonas asturiensis]QHF02421.1 hypothetical protein N015_08355 [Pseudomonas asturiensis]